MKRVLLVFVAGLIIGELDPVGWAVWQVAERQLVHLKERSLAEPSPFEKMPSSRWVAESEHAYVIEDRYAPIAPVHLLVIPKKRYTTLLEPPPAVLGEMLDLARRVARQRGIAESGFRVTIHTNPQGLQTAYHLHMNVTGGGTASRTHLTARLGVFHPAGQAHLIHTRVVSNFT